MAKLPPGRTKTGTSEKLPLDGYPHLQKCPRQPGSPRPALCWRAGAAQGTGPKGGTKATHDAAFDQTPKQNKSPTDFVCAFLLPRRPVAAKGSAEAGGRLSVLSTDFDAFSSTCSERTWLAAFCPQLRQVAGPRGLYSHGGEVGLMGPSPSPKFCVR